MSEFQREERYIVIKRSDLEKMPVWVQGTCLRPLSNALCEIRGHLPKRKFLVIESDWPEYEVAWSMIEARMTGIATHATEDLPAMADLNLQVFEELLRTQAQLATSKGLAGIQHDDLNRYTHELAARDLQIVAMTEALCTCERWFAKHAPTAPLIGGFGDADHPMLTFIRAALANPPSTPA